MHQYLYSDQDRRPASANKLNLLRKSRSLASMLPSFMLSAVVTLTLTALMRLMWLGVDRHFFSAWMESWLTLWPIAFPIMYLLGSPLRKLAARISPQASA